MKQTRIKKEAARWLIELETTADRDTCRANLERWFNEDPRHRAAFDSMEQVWKAVDDLKIFHIGGGEHSESTHSISERKDSRERRLLNLPLANCAALLSVVVCIVACGYWVFQSAKPVSVPAAYWEKYST